MADELEAPKLVIHSLCGEEMFYYFGTLEDAKILKNFNDIGTLDGSAVTPQDIASCPHCGERIMIHDLQVVHHEVKETHVTFGPEMKNYIEARAKYIEEQMKNRIQRAENEALWSEINDAFRIRKPKTE